MAASSLAAVVTAQMRLADADLAALEARRAELEADRESARADVAAYHAVILARAEMRDRLRRDALRVIAGPMRVPPSIPAIEQDAIEDERAFAEALRRREQRAVEDDQALAAIAESVAAKRAQLARLDARARLLASSDDAGTGSLAVLRSLADEAAATARAIAELMRDASGTAAVRSWQWPVRGVVTQAFGPSALTIEPPVVFRGMTVAHFHDAIDIAAPFGTPVVAASDGRVTLVGHLPDGAMVVLIAHDDGVVSLSAHLDDTYAPPPVRPGARVGSGQVVGFVGVSGMTTGPHLHFAVHDAGGPIDPLSLLGNE